MSNPIYGAYLEDYRSIKVIIPKDLASKQLLLSLKGDDFDHPLNLTKTSVYGAELHCFCTSEVDIWPHHDYQVFIADEYYCPLSLGCITRSPLLEERCYYRGFLGVDYTPQETRFNVWSPVAKEVILVLNNDEEHGMAGQRDDYGHWQVVVEGDLAGMEYYYRVRINQDFVKVLDPYAVGSTANHTASLVIDWSKTYQMQNKRPIAKTVPENYVIYETHLRDFSYQLVDHTKRVSYYQAFLTNPYAQKLNDFGITHVQLMPVNAFGGVDELRPNDAYNWGYNPIQYNVPSGWYASDASDPYCRINELKVLIDGIHAKGLGVTLDVVYNHVYQIAMFSLAQLMPGYFFRTDKQGFLLNSSGCGNDFACEQLMARRFIKDSINHWFEHYQVDGFRFDLMGLLDMTLINEIKAELSKTFPTVLIYGEGWEMASNLPLSNQASLRNGKKMPAIAFFNDRFRNAIRGDNGYCQMGLAQGNDDLALVEALLHGKLYAQLQNKQLLNYLECHDNRTFFDQLAITVKDPMQVKARFILGYALLALAPGMALIHSGGMGMRSKRGLDNTYNLGDEINAINWQQYAEHTDVIVSMQALWSLRKKYSDFRLATDTEVLALANHTYVWQNDKYAVYIHTSTEKYCLVFSSPKTLWFDGCKLTNQLVTEITLTSPMVVFLEHN